MSSPSRAAYMELQRNLPLVEQLIEPEYGEEAAVKAALSYCLS